MGVDPAIAMAADKTGSVSPYLLRPRRSYEEALRDRMRNGPGQQPRAGPAPAPDGMPAGDGAPKHSERDPSARPQPDRKTYRRSDVHVPDRAGPR